MKIFLYIYFLAACLFPLTIFAQSYSIQIDESEYDFCCNELIINEQEEEFLLSFESGSPYIYLTEINPNSTQNKCFQLEYKNGSRPWLPEWQVIGTLYTDKYLFFQHMPENEFNTSLVMFNTDDESFWARKIDYFGIHHRLTFSEEKKLLYSFQSQGHAQNQDAFTMKSFCFDLEGNNIWQNGYRISSNFEITQINLAAVVFENNKLFAIMALGRPEDFATGVIRFDLEGNVEESIIIEEHSEVFNMTVSENGSIYLLGETLRVQDNLASRLNAVLIKLDQNFNVIWSKIITAESFDIRASQISCVGEDLYLAYASYGNLSVILAKINSDGQIIKQKGLPHFEPKLSISQLGSFYLSYDEERDSDGVILNKSGILKTSLEDDSKSCPFYTSCLELVPFETETNILNVFRNDVKQAELDTIFIEEKTVKVEDYCFDLEVPQANFNFPDTLCALSCESVSSLQENTLFKEEWLITNENQDTIYIGEEDQTWCFDDKGSFEISHTLWYLGCSHTHIEQVKVVDEFEFEIVETEAPCLLEDPSILSLNSINEVEFAKWSTGQEGIEIEIFQSGVYEVTATDGFCENTMSIDIVRSDLVIEEILNFEEVVYACRVSLPFTLRPSSMYGNNFYHKNEIFADSVILLNAFGSYNIKTEFQNCILEKEFKLLEDECEIAMYLPTVFSPNNDGINDDFLPLGKGFEIKRLQIFDRWGAMMFEANDTQFFWNGTFRGKLLDPGVFYYYIEYINKKSLQMENVQGDILLKK